MQASSVLFGTPESFQGAARNQNPKGFWEHRDIRNVCDYLLHSIGLDWDQVSDFDPAKNG